MPGVADFRELRVCDVDLAEILEAAAEGDAVELLLGPGGPLRGSTAKG